MNDSESRLAAQFDLGSNMVVEAAAGTGKTSLLIARILSLTLAGDSGQGYPLENIAALTFTNKAAAEMKIRLAQQLHQIATLIHRPDEAQPAVKKLVDSLKERFSLSDHAIEERVSLALSQLERAPIETVHSFVARILRLYPLDAGLSPSFDIDQGKNFNRIFESEWEEWLDIELGFSMPREKDWLQILKFVTIKDLKELAKQLAQKGIPLSLIHQTSKETEGSLKRLLDQLEEILEGKPPPKSKIFLDKFSDLKNQIRALTQIPEAKKSGIDILENWNPTQTETSWPKWPKAWEEDKDQEAIYQRAQKIVKYCSLEKHALVQRATGLLAPFCDRIGDSFRKAGFISFDGILIEARNLLKDNLKIRSEIKRRYHSFLVDEFQDTDPLQGEILFLLAEDLHSTALDWKKVTLGPGRIFVVGDPKQSIYRFRGADIAAYQDFTRKILSQPKSKALSLNLNFRSKAEVLRPINSLFSKTMKEIKGLQAAHQNLETTQSLSSDPAFQIIKLSFSGDSAKSQDFQKAEAQWICQWIDENCGPQKKFRYKDVAVLWRTQLGSSYLTEALKDAQIPYAAQLRNSLYSSQEFIDFMNLIRVLDDPDDQIAFNGVLRSPLTDTKDSNLTLNKIKGKSAEALEKTLRNLRSQLGRIPLPVFLDRVIKETALLPIAAKAYHGAQAVSNILKASRLAEEIANKEGLTAREMIERVLREVQSGEEEGESPLADDSLDCVRLLTIHKAKGLEFPIVFIPRISSQGQSNEIPFSLADWKTQTVGFYLPKAKAASLNMAVLRISERERLNHEALRLLYVGLTRAKEKIFLIGDMSFSPEDYCFSRFLSADLSLPSKDINVDSSFLNPKLNRQKPIKKISITPEKWALKWKDRFQPTSLGSRPWSLTPTQNTSRLFDETDSLPRSNQAAVLGQLCHEALRILDFKNPGELRSIIHRAAIFLSQLDLTPPEPKLMEEAERLIHDFLGSSSAQTIIQSKILGREIPFAYQERDSIIRGTIDMVYQNGNETIVADYKTGPAPKSQEEEKLALKRYQSQARIYLKAIEKTLGKKARFQLLFLRRPESPIWYNEKDVFQD